MAYNTRLASHRRAIHARQYSPVTGAMFRQDTDEPLDTAQDRTMDHDGPEQVVLAVLGRCSVLELESFGQVEVELRRKRLDDCLAVDGIKGLPEW